MDEQDDARRYETVVVPQEGVSRSSWLVLTLALIAAVLVLRSEQIAAWFAPRAEAVLAEVRSSLPETRERSAPEIAKPRMASRAQPAPDARDARDDGTPSRAPMTPVAPPAAAPAPENASAALPPIQPLFPVSAVPAQAGGPEGRAGLVEALRAGSLRPATGADIARWQSRYATTHGRSPGSAFDDRLRMMEAYVIQDDLVLPGGLHGAHAVVFLLDLGVPFPRGDTGHSVILDLGSGACVGVTCGSLLQSQ